MTHKIVVSHWVHSEVLDFLRRHGQVIANETRESLDRAELLHRCRDAEALLAFMPDRIDGKFLDQCPRLKIISGAFKGADNVDAEECARRTVSVTVVPDLLTAPTAELAVGLTLALMRKILEGDSRVRTGTFTGWRPILYGATLERSRVGILGYGRLGQAIARRLEGFGPTLRHFDPKQPDSTTLEELLSTSDVLVVAAPLSRESLHLIDGEALSRLPAGAMLVNVGRGSVVDEDAVAGALASGHLGGYAADVFEMEDLSRPDRPDRIPPSMLSMRHRTVFTPHLGSAVDSARREIALSAARSIADVLSGRRPADAVGASASR